MGKGAGAPAQKFRRTRQAVRREVSADGHHPLPPVRRGHDGERHEEQAEGRQRRRADVLLLRELPEQGQQRVQRQQHPQGGGGETRDGAAEGSACQAPRAEDYRPERQCPKDETDQAALGGARAARLQAAAIEGEKAEVPGSVRDGLRRDNRTAFLKPRPFRWKPCGRGFPIWWESPETGP